MKKLWHALMEHFVPSERNTYRPHLLRKSWLIFFLTILITTEGVFATSSILNQTPTSQPAAVVPFDVVTLTNIERAQENVPSLTEEPRLDAAAQAKANDMALHSYFSHIGPDGKEPWAWVKEADYSYKFAGENLAVRFNESADVVAAWMASPSHRANIVKPVYTNIGVGVARGSYKGSPATYIVQYFGTPLDIFSAAPEDSVPLEAQDQVAGAQTSVHDTQTNSFVRQVGEAVSDSSQNTSWVLGGVLLLVLFVLALTFFVHIEIQSHEMLIGGAVVAGVAALFLLLNAQVSLPNEGTSQSANVGQIQYSVLVGEEAASTEVTSSPQLAPQTQPIELSE